MSLILVELILSLNYTFIFCHNIYTENVAVRKRISFLFFLLCKTMKIHDFDEYFVCGCRMTEV